MAYTTQQKERIEANGGLRYGLGDRVECNIGRIGEEPEAYGLAAP
jgi:hypothetical protein